MLIFKKQNKKKIAVLLSSLQSLTGTRRRYDLTLTAHRPSVDFSVSLASVFATACPRAIWVWGTGEECHSDIRILKDLTICLHQQECQRRTPPGAPQAGDASLARGGDHGAFPKSRDVLVGMDHHPRVRVIPGLNQRSCISREGRHLLCKIIPLPGAGNGESHCWGKACLLSPSATKGKKPCRCCSIVFLLGLLGAGGLFSSSRGFMHSCLSLIDLLNI